ncbi:protein DETOXIFICATION 31 [Sesamum angolense]|uniref:Protein DETOXIFICATION n=1 Tax=Sesamum angolense TaxID=2727404 RepID=A0AAE2C1S3_9LAMI|nr:protein DETOXIFICATION 31 [Sesamum angolense]
MSENFKEPLLEHREDEDDHAPGNSSSPKFLAQLASNLSFFSSFVIGEDDIPPIIGIPGFMSAFKAESSKLWYLAGPAIFTSIFQYSIGAITQTFAGHVGTIDLAAFSVVNNFIAGFCFGIMMGMGSALETLCGQAYGAGQMDMLGVYMQRSWVILLSTSFLLTFMYILAEPLLLLLGQTEAISRTAGKFALWMIPQLYAYAMNFPIAKFLQAQSNIMAMAWISAVALVLHVLFSWLLMLKLGWGMAGGAMVLNASWWFLVVAQLIYVFSGACAQSWTGFCWKAFQNLWGFVRLSVASAVMLCLEIWYFTALVLFAGHLKNAEIAVDALSICVNIAGWISMIALGFNAAVSVRVSNELGRSSKSCKILSAGGDTSEVKQVVYELTPMLAFCIVLSNVQPALSGVAIGAGWQTLVAYVNIACYYVFGIPVGLFLGYKLKWGVQGIWWGMTSGTVVQTLVLFWIVYRNNWDKEASAAAKRIKKWGGETGGKENDLEKL